jgi:dynein heavy chain
MLLQRRFKAYPTQNQFHSRKCYWDSTDGIRSLDFGEDPKSIDIYAMVSSEGERILLGKNLKARGNVENWLTAVEQNMVASLRRSILPNYVLTLGDFFLQKSFSF